MNAILPMIMGFGYMIGPLVMGRTVLVTGVKNGWLIIGLILALCSLMMHMLEKMSLKLQSEEDEDAHLINETEADDSKKAFEYSEMDRPFINEKVSRREMDAIYLEEMRFQAVIR